MNRIDEAKATYEQALRRKLKNHFFSLALYEIAFLHDDAAGMAQQVAASAGTPGMEAILIADEADTAAYSGRLRAPESFPVRQWIQPNRLDTRKRLKCTPPLQLSERPCSATRTRQSGVTFRQ